MRSKISAWSTEGGIDELDRVTVPCSERCCVSKERKKVVRASLWRVRVWCAYVFRYALGRAIVRRQVDTGNLIQYVETRIFWEKQTNEEHRKQKEKVHDSSWVCDRLILHKKIRQGACHHRRVTMVHGFYRVRTCRAKDSTNSSWKWKLQCQQLWAGNGNYNQVMLTETYRGSGIESYCSNLNSLFDLR